jgi:hypothetical protein
VLDRRTLMAHTLAAMALRVGAARGEAGALFVGCRIEENGYTVSAVDGRGRLRWSLPLPDRGHSVTFHPTRPLGVVFARRPGRFAVVFDHDAGTVVRRIDAAPDRHFYGHGTFTAGGRFLITSENAYASGEGKLGVRDATDGFRQVGELPSHGVGPHDVRLMPDGRTLVVANGGIRTHPDFERKKLNLAEMAPSLSFLDIETGTRIDDFRLPAALHQLSIRHLDVAADGRVGVAMQYQGRADHDVPLVAVCDGAGLRPVEASTALGRELRHYTGSAAFDGRGRHLAVSGPRGDLVTIWDSRDGRLAARLDVPDGCGVAAAGDGFVLTSGVGRVLRWSAADGLTPLNMAAGGWDNHLMARGAT